LRDSGIGEFRDLGILGLESNCNLCAAGQITAWRGEAFASTGACRIGVGTDFGELSRVVANPISFFKNI